MAGLGTCGPRRSSDTTQRKLAQFRSRNALFTPDSPRAGRCYVEECETQLQSRIQHSNIRTPMEHMHAGCLPILANMTACSVVVGAFIKPRTSITLRNNVKVDRLALNAVLQVRLRFLLSAVGAPHMNSCNQCISVHTVYMHATGTKITPACV